MCALNIAAATTIAVWLMEMPFIAYAVRFLSYPNLIDTHTHSHTDGCDWVCFFSFLLEMLMFLTSLIWKKNSHIIMIAV